MHIALVDSLRCPAAHADSWLVASCDRMEARHIIEGMLGCPVCKAEYPVRDGAVWFDPADVPRDVPGDGVVTRDAPTEDDAVRLAAFLDLTDARGFAVLCGEWAIHAPLMSAIAPTPLLLLNPPPGIPSLPEFSSVHCRPRAPLAAGSVRAAAIERDLAESMVPALAPGARVVGPVRLDVPPGIAIVARDDRAWVGERTADSELISIGRRRPG